MEINLDYNNIDFKDKIINLPKGVKIVNIYGDNINISTLCDILENVKNNIEIRCNYNKEINNEFLKRNTYQGFNRSILNMVKKICVENVTSNDYVVDMTVGNGNDTLFLANISTSKAIGSLFIIKLYIFSSSIGEFFLESSLTNILFFI